MAGIYISLCRSQQFAQPDHENTDSRDVAAILHKINRILFVYIPAEDGENAVSRGEQWECASVIDMQMWQLHMTRVVSWVR